MEIYAGTEVVQRVRRLLGQLNHNLLEKEHIMLLALLAAVAGESIFLLGPPGVAKSLIARRLKFALRVFTNAYLIDDAVADRLKEVGVVETSISIHGASAEIHEKLTRIPGSFQRVVDAVARLRERGMRVVLKTPVTSLNENDLFRIKALADEHGAFMVYDTTITPRFDGDVSPLALAPSEDFYRWFWSPAGAPLRGGVQPAKKSYKGRDELEGCCGTGRSGLMVDPYGNVFPCALWFRKLGNVREQSVGEIWDGSEQLQEVRRIAAEIQRDVVPAQEDGEYMSWCPATAESMTGDATQAYRPVLLNAKYMKQAFEAKKQLVQIEGVGEAEPCPHD